MLHHVLPGRGGTLRQLNTDAVLHALFRDGGARTVTELATSLSLSRPTVESVLTDLEQVGWVAEDRGEDLAARKAGRPARRYRFEAGAGAVLGIDLGPHSLRATLADLRGRPLATTSRRDVEIAAFEDAWALLEGSVDALLADASVDAQRVVAATIGVPGIVDADGSLVLSTVVPEWVQAGLRKRLADRLVAADVRLVNDAKLAARAELLPDVGRRAEQGVFLLVGSRIAAATVSAGAVTFGRHGAAGEIGALARAGWAEAHREVGDDLERLFADAGAGDLAAAAAAQRFAGSIAQGVAALCLTLDPEVVVVGGGVSRAGEAFIAMLRRELEPLVLYMPEVRASTLGPDGVVAGAIARCLDHVRSHVLGLQ